ncbi:spore germination protein [Litchfieldia salsa]|uniref:Spore germination protein KA/spore germination protein n=1 Tax=Litchfieldia salsa TaxID=930152 RepID=A0A1H0WIP6_9BACI|nr:spore germination protein [Litchfieldia salsa]SDP90146.1 spore germination protein KA/spore germination protein [Litchfieldia salsa]
MKHADKVRHLLKQSFNSGHENNLALFKEILSHNDDIVYREFVFHDHNRDIKGTCIYTDGLVNSLEINAVLDLLVYRANELLTSMHETMEGPDFADKLKNEILAKHNVKLTRKVEEGIDAILSGDSLFVIDHSEQAFIASTKGWKERSVEDPATEQVVRGPRDGFTENIRTNTALVRRRIRDPLFKMEGMKIGTKSKTDINIAYLEGTVKPSLVDEVKERLQKIKIDSIMDSGYIEELISDAPYSPFTTVLSTERPDKVASAILEGRVAVFVDNSPFVLLMPTYFWQFLQASDDYYSRYMAGSFFRIIRYIAFVISLTLPSLYVMLVSFHQEMIPTPLALTIASGREVVPFPVLLEAIVMEIAFELMREAGLRMPKPVGQAVSIVGSLIIGQAAVQAGLVSPFMVIIVAVTGISSFAIPNYAASFSIRLIRFPLLVASGTLGLLGFATMFTLLAIHALTIRSFGESYLAPAAPFQPSDQKDIVVRMPWWKMEKQPQLAEGVEDRVGSDQLPEPPEKGPKK